MSNDDDLRGVDPDSGLPVGTIIQNAKGEYGVIGYRQVIRITKEKLDELLRSLGETPPD